MSIKWNLIDKFSDKTFHSRITINRNHYSLHLWLTDGRHGNAFSLGALYVYIYDLLTNQPLRVFHVSRKENFNHSYLSLESFQMAEHAAGCCL